MSAPPTPLQSLIRNLSLRAPLDADDCRMIAELPVTMRTLEASTYVIREAERPGLCFVLTAGFAFRQKLTGDGSQQIIALHIPGDPIDLNYMALDVADHSVQMLTRGDIAVIVRSDVQQLVKARPAVGHALFVNMLAEASISREWIVNVGRRNALTRTAHLLCELGARLEAADLIDEYGYMLPMTQERLSDALGLTSVHVNRMLKALEADGLISRTKRKINFPQWERLRSIGDFNQRYLHLHTDLFSHTG
ncbi:Crp/Fnr family transcriptional regulator [Sphingomonas sp. BT553]|uniref:Crp/Fnr family transcriptional regulator n=1 Tax=Sphingomonas mollis TaxID=2795726 RepID=A0ABS0XSV3_9SPHN|nr:Crp/Fnr family transcriptional regulator [Sphingomonas sp. BT553]